MSTSYQDTAAQQPSASTYSYSAPSQSTAAATSSGKPAQQPQPRQPAEDVRKDATLAEFMLMLDDYEPLVYYLSASCCCHICADDPITQIPNEVTDYYLQRVGFECEDVRLYSPVFSQAP
jgi:hypothetical protein